MGYDVALRNPASMDCREVEGEGLQLEWFGLDTDRTRDLQMLQGAV